MRRVQLTRMSGDCFEARAPAHGDYTVGEFKKLLSKQDRTRPPESLIVLWREEDFAADNTTRVPGSPHVCSEGKCNGGDDQDQALDSPSLLSSIASPMPTSAVASPLASKAKARAQQQGQGQKGVNIGDLDFEALALADSEPLFLPFKEESKQHGQGQGATSGSGSGSGSTTT